MTDRYDDDLNTARGCVTAAILSAALWALGFTFYWAATR